MNREIFPRNIYVGLPKPEGISDAEWDRLTELSELDRSILERERERAKVWADKKLDDLLRPAADK